MIEETQMYTRMYMYIAWIFIDDIRDDLQSNPKD